MQIENSVALITGANRGIGRHFAQDLLRRGASKVYATARRPESIDIPGVEVLPLDVTDLEAVAAVAEAAADTTLLINNAGIATGATLINSDLSDIRQEMETNYFGSLNMVRAFAPHLARNGGGAILNVLSVLAWVGFEYANGYGASKAAGWAMSNGLRVELAPQNTQVSSLFLASTDTDMMAGSDVEKNRPEDVVATALDGIEKGQLEILADDISVQLKAGLSQELGEFQAQPA